MGNTAARVYQAGRKNVFLASHSPTLEAHKGANECTSAAHKICGNSVIAVSYGVLKEDKLSTNDAAYFSYSYSFAIVGINITDLAYNLLVSGALKTHFYNVAPEAPTLTHFQQTFCKWQGLGNT